MGDRGSSLVFPDAYSELVEAIAHYSAHPDEVVDGAESTGGEVALGVVSVCEQSGGRMAYLVLDWLVAAFWREILTHCSGG